RTRSSSTSRSTPTSRARPTAARCSGCPATTRRCRGPESPKPGGSLLGPEILAEELVRCSAHHFPPIDHIGEVLFRQPADCGQIVVELQALVLQHREPDEPLPGVPLVCEIGSMPLVLCEGN